MAQIVKRKKFFAYLSIQKVKESIDNAYSCFKEKGNKATHSYLITLAFQSRGDMLYVGPNTKKKNKVVLLIYQQWDSGQWTLEISPIVNANAYVKGEQPYIRLFGHWPSGQGGTCFKLAQIQRWRLLTLIQWVILHI